MVTVIPTIRTFACAVSAAPARMSTTALGVLRDAAFGSLFWAMLLIGSIGMAVSVIFISHSSHIARAIVSYLS